MKKEMTILEFAAKTGKHPITVRRWVLSGKVSSRKALFSGAYLIPVSELQKVNA